MALSSSFGVGEDAVEDVEVRAGVDAEAGFFKGLGDGSGTEGFAEFEDSAESGPLALDGLGVAANKPGAVAVVEDGSDAGSYRRGMRSAQSTYLMPRKGTVQFLELSRFRDRQVAA